MLIVNRASTLTFGYGMGALTTIECRVMGGKGECYSHTNQQGGTGSTVLTEPQPTHNTLWAPQLALSCVRSWCQTCHGTRHQWPQGAHLVQHQCPVSFLHKVDRTACSCQQTVQLLIVVPTSQGLHGTSRQQQRTRQAAPQHGKGVFPSGVRVDK